MTKKKNTPSADVNGTVHVPVAPPQSSNSLKVTNGTTKTQDAPPAQLCISRNKYASRQSASNNLTIADIGDIYLPFMVHGCNSHTRYSRL